MLLNIDIGERGADHPTDIHLLDYANIINIACGGHAGNEQSITSFRHRAEQKDIIITAHLSYPDRPNFGRKTMSISIDSLYKSLDTQLALLPHIKKVKLRQFAGRVEIGIKKSFDCADVFPIALIYVGK